MGDVADDASKSKITSDTPIHSALGRRANKTLFTRLEVDSLRGFALIAVVWHHAMLWLPASLESFDLAPSYVYQFAELISTSLAPLRMPLFTILSGLVYALKPVRSGSSKPFLSGKFRRIIIPLFFLSTLQYFQYAILQNNVPMLEFRGKEYAVDQNNFWVFWFFHFGHLWFLQALFTIFIAMMIIDIFKWMDSLKAWIFWIVVFSVLPYIISGNSFWSSNKTAHLVVFFFFGVGLFRFKDTLFQTRYVLTSWAVFVVSMAIYLAWKTGIFEFKYLQTRPFLVLAGTAGSMCLLSLRMKVRWLAWIGGYSYTVYLYHGLAFETHQLFDDILLLGIPGRMLWFGMLVAAGVLIPILVDKVFQSVPLIRTPVLGKKAFS